MHICTRCETANLQIEKADTKGQQKETHESELATEVPQKGTLVESLPSKSIGGVPLVVEVKWPTALVQVGVVVGRPTTALASKSNRCRYRWGPPNRPSSAWVEKSPLGLSLASFDHLVSIHHLVQGVQLLGEDG